MPFVLLFGHSILFSSGMYSPIPYTEMGRDKMKCEDIPDVLYVLASILSIPFDIFLYWAVFPE